METLCSEYYDLRIYLGENMLGGVACLLKVSQLISNRSEA
jgi:hypothetical protein